MVAGGDDRYGVRSRSALPGPMADGTTAPPQPPPEGRARARSPAPGAEAPPPEAFMRLGIHGRHEAQSCSLLSRSEGMTCTANPLPADTFIEAHGSGIFE